MGAVKWAVAAFVLIVLVPGPATATETVEIGGIEYTCTNACVVTYGSNGSWTIRDCCGGTVKFRLA